MRHGLWLLLVACSDPAPKDDTSSTAPTGSTTPSPLTPTTTPEPATVSIASVTISPDRPVIGDTLHCAVEASASDDAALDADIDWSNGRGEPLGDGPTLLLASPIAGGDEVRCLASVRHPAGATASESATVAVLNSAPVFVDASIEPAPRLGEPSACFAVVTDADADPIDLSIQWSNLRTGLVLATEAELIPERAFALPGDILRCALTARDDGSATTVTVDAEVLNRPPPTIDVTLSPHRPTPNQALTCVSAPPAFDDDGDALTWITLWEVDGQPFAGPSRDTLNASFTADGQRWRCAVALEDGQTTTVSWSPEVVVEAAAPGWASVTAGASHTCGIRSDGAAYCWGLNYYGALGDGTALEALRPTPVHSRDERWSQLVAGMYFTCGLRDDATIHCWGWGLSGRLGTGSEVSVLVPTQEATGRSDWAALSTSHDHVLALTDPNEPYGWGANGSGKIGGSASRFMEAGRLPGLPVNLTITQVAAGGNHSCALTEDHRIYCWGRNNLGQIGHGIVGGSTDFEQEATGATDWVSVAAGGDHTCALNTSGEAYCWGSNSGGALGVGDTTLRDRPTPVLSSSGDAWAQISAGVSHTCGLTVAGAVYCWGSAPTSGAVGDGTNQARSVPTREALAKDDWVWVSAGNARSCAIDAGGDAYCWGSHTGDGTRTFHLGPVLVLDP